MSVIVKEEGKTVAIFGKFKDSLELLAKSVVPECKGEIFLTVKDNPRYLFKIAEVENAKPIPLDSGELVEVGCDCYIGECPHENACCSKQGK
ncbi:MAG: hypothetical protein E6R03_10830 [Hyphomicrobiaceae bacterium]|nr:MAG: hypothetical protein E6R03_10830 [Hyphomicrobiaceae bacterium]